MSNSKLISGTMLSPNYTPMANKVVKKITIHHAAGKVTAKRLGEIFRPASRKASANYGIGYAGEIYLYVDEKNRAWTSSSATNDAQAVTIEVANSVNKEPWTVSDKSMESLINLCVDICQRNNIKSLNWTGTKDGNLTVHRMFASTACPGTYLYSKMSYIASETNRRLGLQSKPETTTPATSQTSVSKSEFKVKVTATALNIRASYTTNSKIVGCIKDKGVYTITETKGDWGKLKSGAGWIYLTGYTKRV